MDGLAIHPTGSRQFTLRTILNNGRDSTGADSRAFRVGGVLIADQAILPRHGRSAHRPEAQARIPRLRFGLVLIILAAAAIERRGRAADREAFPHAFIAYLTE